jgi:4-diphosphocytidyl-2-C-methyl-D-erythritol kinase
MPSRVRSYSKINLGLAVGPARSDGFHELLTVYQTLALHDFVTVSARPAAQTSITLQANHPGVPNSAAGTAARNTAYKIVAGALERLRLTAEVDITIDKRLPVQGGMGAGSANAVAALLGLERELGTELPDMERLALAAEVGSDVPLFLIGGTVLGQSRGERVTPLAELDSAPGLPCVVAIPSVGVSTALAFRQLDERFSQSNALTSTPPVDKLEQLSHALAAVWKTDGDESGPSGIDFTNCLELVSSNLSHTSTEVNDRASASGQRDVSGDLAENPLLALVRTGIENDFEEVVFSQHPSLRSTKRDLLGSPVGSGEKYEGPLFAGLSGSGSALFGLYSSQAAARAAQHRVQQNGTRAILTETLPRREYWHTMFAE